jgi:protease-4
MGLLSTLVRIVVFVVVVAVGAAAGWLVFIAYPGSALELAGIVLLLLALPLVVRTAGSVAGSLFPEYNVGEVEVTGPITRGSGGSPLSAAPVGAAADEIVEQIDRANEDGNVEALLLKMNTPGGEIVPSEDIKFAAERFEGPTIAYATDTCASGGYEIASGCDEIWARETSIVGSIGVRGSRVNLSELAEKIGVEYEQLAAGEYKEAGAPLKEFEDHEREYLQGIIDDYYEWFVTNVAERREMDREAIEATEARVYLGKQAKEEGLVDELGTKRDLEDDLEERLGEAVTIRQFEPTHGLSDRLQFGAQRLAFSFGAGIASAVTGDDHEFELR